MKPFVLAIAILLVYYFGQVLSIRQTGVKSCCLTKNANSCVDFVSRSERLRIMEPFIDYVQLGTCLLSRGDCKGAEDVLLRGLSEYGNSSELLHLLVLIRTCNDLNSVELKSHGELLDDLYDLNDQNYLTNYLIAGYSLLSSRLGDIDSILDKTTYYDPAIIRRVNMLQSVQYLEKNYLRDKLGLDTSKSDQYFDCVEFGYIEMMNLFKSVYTNGIKFNCSFEEDYLDIDSVFHIANSVMDDQKNCLLNILDRSEYIKYLDKLWNTNGRVKYDIDRLNMQKTLTSKEYNKLSQIWREVYLNKEYLTRYASYITDDSKRKSINIELDQLKEKWASNLAFILDKKMKSNFNKHLSDYYFKDLIL